MLRLHRSLAPVACALLTLTLPLSTFAQEQPTPPDPFVTSADELAPAEPSADAPPDDSAAQPAAQPTPAPGAPQTVIVVQAPPGYQQAAPVAAPAPVVRPYASPVVEPLPSTRGGAEVVADIGGGLLGVGAGIGLMYAMLRGSTDLGDALMVIVFGPLITFALTDLGIYGFGRMTGGQGSFWLTTAGTAAGAGLGALIGFRAIAAATDYSDAGMWTGLGFTIGFAIAGGVAMFELTDRRNRRRSGYALTPYVAPTRGGLSFGLGATF
ncbi:MAG: hypothetical protein GXP55_18310 [Deltaproteobacteria bacterium]|nr:hypothetical protein [Deltaproteobacteria bacterium]